MEEDLVSIIMPTYNCGKFIAESIECVLKQTYTNWELLIQDDCSTDNTKEIVRDYLKDNRIRYAVNEKNSGAAVSRNAAIAAAKGGWIAFLDSDDLWEPEKLKKQLSFMKRNSYFFSYTKYAEINEDGNLLGVEVSGPKIISYSGMINYCWPGCLTVMYNAEKIGKIQIADIKKNNDYAMWLKIAPYAKCYLLDETLAKYRKREGSISNHSYTNLIKWHYLLFKEAEGCNTISSYIHTIRNLFFGVVKKCLYVKRK